jgi:transposase
VLADKAYTSRKKRRYLRRRGISHTIPERLDQQRHRRNRGSRGGRPTGFDNERYKKRNTVERASNDPLLRLGWDACVRPTGR